MPGPAGFTAGNDASARAALARTRALPARGESQRADELFRDGRVCATRTHTGIIEPLLPGAYRGARDEGAEPAGAW